MDSCHALAARAYKHSLGRRRKVKCQLTEEDVEACAECIKSGTKCTLKPPETEGNESALIGVGGIQNDSRLERIESLLQRLVDSQEQSQAASRTFESEVNMPSTLWDDFVSF